MALVHLNLLLRALTGVLLVAWAAPKLAQAVAAPAGAEPAGGVLWALALAAALGLVASAGAGLAASAKRAGENAQAADPAAAWLAWDGQAWTCAGREVAPEVAFDFGTTALLRLCDGRGKTLEWLLVGERCNPRAWHALRTALWCSPGLGPSARAARDIVGPP